MMDKVNLASQIILGLGCMYVLLQFIRSIRMVPTKTALVVERLGKYSRTLNPGFHVLIPFIDKVAYEHDLKEETIVVDPQECFTLDNVQVEVDGIIYMSVNDPVNSSYGITDYRYAAIQLAQTTTRAIIGTIELDQAFEERELISAKVVGVLGEVATGWGVTVHRYEVKNITPPATVKDSMEKQMAAERERRATIMNAEGASRAMINESEGIKQEMINKSLGEKQKQINEAEGQAAEILSIARATASSITKVAKAISVDNGDAAVKMRLSQLQLSNLEKLADADTGVVLPMDLGEMKNILKSVDLTPAK